MIMKTTTQNPGRFKKAALALLLILFAGMTMQAQQNIYMHTGSRTLVGNEVVNFYDSGGESSGPAYYWERWFSRGEDYTFTFKPETGKKIKVTFKQFTAYTDNNEHSPAHVFTTHALWALRINDGTLSIYDGLTADAENLITTYTGSVIDEFTVIANGAMTFQFHSNYREEGWQAEVTQVDAYTVQKPSISFQVCDDQVVLNANSPHSVIYYTTDGTDPSVPTKDPLSAGILYEGPFSVNLNQEVRAIACDTTLTGNNTSAVASLTYKNADVTPTPGKPTITRTGNTITMEPAALIGDINETYKVWYTTEEGGAYAEYTGPIEWNTPNTTFYAITKPVSCSDKISEVETLLFDKVQVPDPTITFTVTNQTTGVGTVQINCPQGYVLSYTTDGSDPTTTGGTTNSVTLTDVAPGTTVKAIAYKVTNGALDPNYKASNIITKLCLPGGDGSQGVYGGIVLLDDREEHTWSYYNDGDQPVHNLKPADVKITYFGYGEKTMTSTNTADTYTSATAATAFDTDVTSEQVAVNVNEPSNQFIYFKTLENADPEGNGTNYPYTMIPNPFQVRPVYDPNSGGGTSSDVNVTIGSGTSTNTNVPVETFYNYSISQQIYLASEIGRSGTIRSISFKYNNTATTRTIQVYLKHTPKTSFSNTTDWVSLASSDLVYSGSVAFANGTWTTINLTTPFVYNGTDNLLVCVDDDTGNYTGNSDRSFYSYSTGGNRALYYRNDITNPTPTNIEQTGTSLQTSNAQIAFGEPTSSSSDNNYRGFYAWRVKSLSSGLSIQDKTSKATYGVGDIIYADQEVEFVTGNAKGNEVEFEALWAKAYVTTSTNTTSLNSNVSYERNFMVLSSNTSSSTTTETIGSGTATNYAMALPLNSSRYYYDDDDGTWYNGGSLPYSCTEQIYTASEIGGEGVLTSMDFYVNNVNTQYVSNLSRNLIVYITYTSRSEFRYAPGSDNVNRYWMEGISASDRVFSGTVNFNSTGWHTITFNTPFEYDGVSNIMVCVIDNTGSCITNNYYQYGNNYNLRFGTYATNSNRALSFRDDASPVATLEGGTIYGLSSAITYCNRIRFNKTINANGTSLSELSVPVTVMACKPDGSDYNANIYVSGTISCENDLKLENIRLNGSATSTITANGHDFIAGRGITGNLATGRIRGVSSGSSNPVKYTIRLESGTYGAFDMIDNEICEFGSTVSTRAIFGSDYDRAKPDNDKLSVAPSGTVYGGNASHVFNGQDNRNNITYDWLIKSGKVQSVQDLGDAEAERSIYMGNSIDANDNDALKYCGKRRLTMEGGEIASIAGGVNCYGSNYSTYAVNDNTWSVLVRIKGGTVRGAIYGAAAFAGASGDRRFVMTGGTVNGWIAGGCNGTHNDGGELYGISNIYVGGKTQVIPSSSDPYIGGTSTYGTNGAYGGYIFGAGCGIAPVGFDETDPNPNWSLLESNTVGKVFGSRVVVADECEVGRDIYGGGNFGFVAGDSGDMGLTGNTDMKADIYVLGGTVHGDVQGGSNNSIGQTVNIYVRGGEIIGRDSENPQYPNDNLEGSVYGGSDTWGVINGPATIEITGGHLKGSVFGGGYGPETDMAGGTYVNVKGGTIDQNVYGGGEMGTVSNGDTHINVSGGTMQDVYGAGKGDKDASEAAQVTGQTFVTVTGGTVANVYGGGEAGDVVNGTNLASIVTIDGATVSGDVFGGGKMGYTTGNTQVNIESGNVRGNVFGGAYGATGSVFVAGMHTVNIMGGRVFGNVYGGSRNANDALAFTGYNTNETATNAVVNISAGQIDQQVYAAGFYGHTYGSVYAFIGKEAILNAPHKAPSFGSNNETQYSAGNLRITGNVWAGGDWGDFTSGSFGSPTVSGYSDIFVDGDGYNTETTDESAPTYMNLKGSILGCGTSCDAGKQGRTIMVRNYGKALASGSKNDNFPEPYTEATRDLYSIQRADTLILDNAHINFIGLAKINSLDATEKYAIYSFDQTVRIVGGSSLFMNAISSQIKDWWNASCTNVYAANATYSAVTYDNVSATPNKIRVNGGNYIEIYHDKMINNTTAGYGMLNGFAYMMVSQNASENTCAYARPKDCDVTPIDETLDNPTDGGWVSYDVEKNTMTIDGVTVSTGSSDQMPYENHVNSTKSGEQYFRIWRAGGKYSEREAVVNILADGTSTFGAVTVSVKLPAWKTSSSYYTFKTTGDGNNLNTTIDYGSDLMMYNSAYTDNTASAWLHYDKTNETLASGSIQGQLDEIASNPNVNYGMVIAGGTAMSGGPLVVCNESDEFLASVNNGTPVNKLTCSDFEKNPEVSFTITYSNLISTNMTWDPMYVTLVQYNGTEVIDIVKIAITINTATTIDREFTTQVYAIMNKQGSPHDEYVAKVVLPTFELFDPTAEHASQFKVTSVTFEPEATDASQNSWMVKGSTFNAVNKFAMEVGAANNEDNSDGWNGTATGMTDSKTAANYLLGESGGRTPFAFDFRLTYDGTQEYKGTLENAQLGTLTFVLTYDNVKVDGYTTAQTKTLTIHVQIIRRGTGNAFYLDGQNGSNANSGLNPDKAVLSLSTIFNRLGFLPGDVVYVVNTVDVTKTMDWTGTRYDHVVIYRYPGGHALSTEDATIVDNEDNTAFTGALLNIKEKGNMTLQDIYLDGHNEAHPRPGVNDSIDKAVTAAAPLANVASGSTLILTTGSKLQHNSSTNNGGAVVVNDGGTLMMNENATIRYNDITGADMNGGAVYMAGTIIVSDSIQIDTNYKASAFNNVYLAGADNVITIGTSASIDYFDALSEDAHIGVTKTASDADGWYRVVYAESDLDWLEVPYAPRPNDIIYHDGQKYQLEKHTSPNYLYWVSTWVVRQDHEPTEALDGKDWEGIGNITTANQLAWLISLVNGENGQDPHTFSGQTVVINADIDMDDDIWVPIGTTTHPFMGTFEGNGHVITGIRTPLVNTNAGMMGYTEGAAISDAIIKVNFTGNSVNQGAVIGTMKGGSLNNVEAAGNLNGSNNTLNMGGLVGVLNTGTIHSSFAVNTMSATVDTTIMGGLVGVNGGNLYNSYANVSVDNTNASTRLGGLVGVNNENCIVENCYVINPIGPAFAYNNQGNINYCYAADGTTTFVGNATGGTLTYTGTYAPVMGRKELGYMYGDNKVTSNGNGYVKTTHEYLNNHTVVWDGLLSVLNQWVAAKNAGYTTWNRPTTQDINGDLPILAFPKDNCLGTSNGKFLVYSAYDPEDLDNNNGLDNLLGTIFNGQSANIYLYQSATNVINGTGTNKLFIHEDAALIQAEGTKDMAEIKATVGVTFDNSFKKANDYFGNKLNYDWHMLSTPLSNAPMGITWNNQPQNWWETGDTGQVTGVEGSYMPDDINEQDEVKWDFYCYYEPQYHWINFKRNSNSHYHYDDNGDQGHHDQIIYNNETTMEKGKGYMMAISQDSYLNNTGTLNKGDVKIALTNSDDGGANNPTRDWGSNLVGNPYQAYLDLETVSDSTGYTSFYVYSAEDNGYKPYTATQSKNTKAPSQYIHPHQAFFVLTDANDNNFKFTYNMATDKKNDQSYFRKGGHIDYPLINLMAENTDGGRNFTTIEVGRPELGGAEKTEALKTNDFDLYAHYGQKDYKLLFTPAEAQRVAMFFTAKTDDTYTLTWNTENGEFSFLRLIDNITGVEVDMLNNDHYTFEGHATDYAARFYILFNNPNEEPGGNGNGEGNGNFAYYDGYGWIINGEGILQLVDVTGRVLYQEYLAGDMNRVHLDNFKAGVYVLLLGDKAQKIVIK